MKTHEAIVKGNMTQTQTLHWWRNKENACAAPSPKPGDTCPACNMGTLAYDGLFVLTCSHCGKAAESGAFT